MSLSGIARPRKDAPDQLPEAGIGIRQIGTDNVAGYVLHPCHRLEPAGLLRPRGLAKDGPALRRYPVNEGFRADAIQILGVLRRRLDVVVDQLFAMQLDRPVKEFTNAVVGQAQEQFVFQRPPITPCDNCPAVRNEGRFYRCGRLFVVVPDHRHPVPQRMEGGRAFEGPVGIAAAAIHEGGPLGGDGIVTIRRPVLIEATNKPDLAGAFADDDFRREKGVGVQPDRALDAVRRADGADLVPFGRSRASRTTDFPTAREVRPANASS